MTKREKGIPFRKGLSHAPVMREQTCYPSLLSSSINYLSIKSIHQLHETYKKKKALHKFLHSKISQTLQVTDITSNTAVT